MLHYQKRAFTLVELLVVISIIGILVGMLIPAVQQVREAARRTACSNNLRQMALATQAFHSTHLRFPPGCDLNTGASWQAFLLPYIEQENLYNTIDIVDPTFDWQDAAGNLAVSTNLQAFRCPSDLVADAIPSHGTVFPERYPSSYLTVSSGTNTSNSDDVSNSDVTYTRLEWNGDSSVLSVTNAIRSGIMTASQRTTFDNNGAVVLLGLKTINTQTSIVDRLSNTALIGEAIFDSSLMIGSTSVGSDHWCIGSFQIDFRGGVNDSTSDNDPSKVSQDESEVTGSMGVPMNLYHLSSTWTSASTLQAQQIAWSFGSWHAGGVSIFAFADGSARILSDSVDELTYANLGHKSDGAILGEF